MRPLTIANPKQVAYVGSLRSQGDESGDWWFTPRDLVRAISRSLGGIDLDPFSCAAANVGIGAKEYFDKDDDAFKQTWMAGSVFMNPPYSRGLCAKACGKFIDEWRKKSFNRGIILVNNMTDTKWFRELEDECAALCIITGRLAFETPDSKRVSGNTRGQVTMLFSRPKTPYLGYFRRNMIPWGVVWKRMPAERCDG